MKRLRKIIFWCHLTAGATVGLIVLVMSITGALLAFQPQIERFVERDVRTVEPAQADAPMLSAGQLFAKLKEKNPDIAPSGLTLRNDPTASAAFSLGRETLYANPYTADVVGEGSKSSRAFFQSVQDWHRWLGTRGDGRATGRGITGFCNLVFLGLAVTGIYIWWPRSWTRTNLASITRFRRGLSGRARNFNWHNATGIWCALVIIVLTATGAVESYRWANNLLYSLTGSEAPPAPAAQPAPSDRGNTAPTVPIVPANLDELLARAQQQAPAWQSISVRLATRADAPITFVISEGEPQNPSLRSQLALNPATAEVVRWEPYSSLSAGRKLRSWIRPIHTGEAGGIAGQIIAFTASLGGGLLVWTGLSLALRRFRSWIARIRSKDQVVLTPVTEES